MVHQDQEKQLTEALTAQPEPSTQDAQLLELGYVPSLNRTRSFATMLFMTLAIAAIPYGMGGPLLSGIIGGGPLSLVFGLLLIIVLNSCIAISLAEMASRYPTAGGPYYWTFRLTSRLGPSQRRVMSYITGWIWLVGNWTITLSVNFGFASLITATVTMCDANWVASSWELILIFYAICIATFVVCGLADRLLPLFDTCAAVLTLASVIAIAIALPVTAKEGRHSAAFAFTHFDASFSGWPTGFSFFIGLLPPAYTFSAVGMIASMAEEVARPDTQVPWAMSLGVPTGGVVALVFVLAINFTLPPMEEIVAAPYGQALPYIVGTVMGTQAGAVVVMILVLLVTLLCSISITTTAARCTFAFCRDKAMPLSSIWSSLHWDRPLAALALVTVIQMLLGLIYLGSVSAFTAFISVGVIALALGYFIPIAVSVSDKRHEVSQAPWNAGPILGPIANTVALIWILFELVLFSMPTVLPVTAATMNYASVVLLGFVAMGFASWWLYARRSRFNSVSTMDAANVQQPSTSQVVRS